MARSSRSKPAELQQTLSRLLSFALADIRIIDALKEVLVEDLISNPSEYMLAEPLTEAEARTWVEWVFATEH